MRVELLHLLAGVLWIRGIILPCFSPDNSSMSSRVRPPRMIDHMADTDVVCLANPDPSTCTVIFLVNSCQSRIPKKNFNGDKFSKKFVNFFVCLFYGEMKHKEVNNLHSGYDTFTPAGISHRMALNRG